MEHKEKQEIKWADVARYYAASGINGHFNRMLAELVGVDGDLAILFLGIVDGARQRRVVDFGSFTPILRALEDMTGDDAKELFMYLHGNYPIFEGTDSQLIALMLGKSFNLTDADGSRMLHWLIQRQFDVFGLIKSGQAIRKEMENK